MCRAGETAGILKEKGENRRTGKERRLCAYNLDEVKGMGRRKKDQGGVLEGVAELFDLPADVVAGLPRLEMVGQRQLYLEHHSGILSYSEEQIDANTPAGVLRVRGSRLTLLAMTAEELRIGGKIDLVEWVSGE